MFAFAQSTYQLAVDIGGTLFNANPFTDPAANPIGALLLLTFAALFAARLAFLILSALMELLWRLVLYVLIDLPVALVLGGIRGGGGGGGGDGGIVAADNQLFRPRSRPRQRRQ